MKMMILKVLKEQFLNQKIQGMGLTKIQVNLITGKNKVSLLSGRLKVYMTEGVKKSEKVEFDE